MEETPRKSYVRYCIETKKASNAIEHPCRFKVNVNRWELLKLLVKEFFHYKSRLCVITSRPCVYGVFSGPLGGFLPRERLCVGCLRCTTQYPDVVKINPNSERLQLGDTYFTPEHVDTIVYEAETGRVPIKGSGYRGKFGGTRWDGIWTDMSEIVRPTRDGIHGREFISTTVDVGEKLAHLDFDENRELIGVPPSTVTIPLPLFFDIPLLEDKKLWQILSQAAKELQTFAIMPLEKLGELKGPHLIPLVSVTQLLPELDWHPKFIELSYWNEMLYRNIRNKFPHTLVILRTSFDPEQLLAAFRAGVRVFHLTADTHGKGKEGEFIVEMIRKIDQFFVRLKCREEVSILGSGGIIAAEHMAKAILCGLDVVGLDSVLQIALQSNDHLKLSQNISVEWGVQRLKNVCGSWRDQLLEVLGAMGIREVRRMRSEMGRLMFQKDLEQEAFGGIRGYPSS